MASKTIRFVVPFIVEKPQMEALVRIAIIKGFHRVDPARAWTDSERRQAMRYAIENLVSDAIAGV